MASDAAMMSSAVSIVSSLMTAGADFTMWSSTMAMRAFVGAAFILSHGDELLGPSAANRVPVGANPVCVDVLRKQVVVINLQRVMAHVHATLGEVGVLGERDGPLHRADGKVPGRCQRGPVGIAPVQPLIPFLHLDGIAVGAHGPEMLRNAGLVDQVPGEPRNVVETRDY